MGRPLAALGLALLLALTSVPSAEAQARRGVQNRSNREAGQADRARNQRQGQMLLDRFAQRVGEALHLDDATSERLLRELQESRAQRTRINARVTAGRQELGQLIQESPADEDRIGSLMDELFDLEVRRAQVAIGEQGRLAEFLTPLQRARVIWLQQRLARQALERRTNRPIP